MKIKKNQFLASFAIIVIFLAFLRLLFPQLAKPYVPAQESVAQNDKKKQNAVPRDIPHQTFSSATSLSAHDVVFKDPKGQPLKNPIVSVPSYSQAFPDSNYVQMESAQQWGVSPVSNRHEAEQRKRDLVFIGASPFYHVDPMRQSIPYLVPRAAVLLHDIGKSYLDSLQLKGVSAHQMIVTSVLRTKEDVSKLRNYNGNATENSCHLYGTTFDISYNRYHTVAPPGEHRRQVSNDTLKWILSEVLNDMRRGGRCYVKYEVKQGCFHITTR